MRSLWLHTSGDSWFHRTDPRSKLVAVVVLLILVLSTKNDVFTATCLGLVLVCAWFLARIPVRTTLWIVAAFVPILVAILLIQGLVRAPVHGYYLVKIGDVGLSTDGLLFGFTLVTRLIAMALAFAIFAMTTNPTDIALAINKLGVPYRYSYLSSFGLRFLPLLQEEAGTLLVAMSVRGAPGPSSRNPVARAGAVAAVLLPLLVGSLRRSIDIALAMELRGYREDRERTYIRRIGFTWRDWALLAAVVVFAAGTLVLRQQQAI